MTIIKGTTKKGENMIKNSRINNGYFLCQVYGNYSPAKAKAWEYCHRLYCKEAGSDNFHISGFNTFGFSVAWTVPQGVRIETPSNSYLVLFPEYC